MLPWALKPLVAPLLEALSTQKKLILFSQTTITIAFFLFTLNSNNHLFFLISVAFFLTIAIASSIHDIVSDGLYIHSLSLQQQKKFIPIRTCSYQIGRLLIKGGLLIIAGVLVSLVGGDTWQNYFLCLTLLALTLTIYHYFKLPEQSGETMCQENSAFQVIKQLFKSKSLLPALLLIFLFNCSEAQMQKVVPLFLVSNVGLHLSIEQLGQILGLCGSIALLLGIFFSGWLITQFSIKRCMLLGASLFFVSHAPLLLLSHGAPSKTWIYTIISVNQLIAGLVNGIYMGYLLHVANKNPYAMTLYTLATSLMALSFILFGGISGFFLQVMGFNNFFNYILLVNVLILFITKRVLSYE